MMSIFSAVNRVVPITRSEEDKVNVQVVDMTPEWASDLLSRNTGNRSVRKTVVDRYAADMKSGGWSFTGDAIRENCDGTLIDGQHRLLACVESGVPFKTVYITGLPLDVRDAIDTGVGRTLGDVLRWRGELQVANLAASINYAYRYENGLLRTSGKLSNNVLLSWFEQNPGLRESVSVGSRVYEAIGIPPRVSAVVHYFTAKDNRDDADSFFEHVASGASLRDDHAAFILRRWWFHKNTDQRKPATLMVLAVTIKAMNAYREGTPINRVGWTAGGARQEDVPKLVVIGNN